MKLESGTTISHYKILSEIGKGGMGEVYLAEDTKLNRKVAIKFLAEEFVNDAEANRTACRQLSGSSAIARRPAATASAANPARERTKASVAHASPDLASRRQASRA